MGVQNPEGNQPLGKECVTVACTFQKIYWAFMCQPGFDVFW